MQIKINISAIITTTTASAQQQPPLHSKERERESSFCGI
jgi:hypothetical protein